MEEVSRISPEEVKRRMDRRADLLILDARSPASYEASTVKIKGSIRIPPGDIANRADELPRDKLIVTY